MLAEAGDGSGGSTGTEGTGGRAADSASEAGEREIVNSSDGNTKEFVEARNSYQAPAAGGGVSSSINLNGKTVDFGHGGRHLEGAGLNIDIVQQAIANEVSTLNLNVGSSYEGVVSVNNVAITYRAFGRSEGVINVGTYFVK
jgi:hypothetical protein